MRQSRVDNQEWTIQSGQSRVDNSEWTIKSGQSRVDNSEWTIKNGQFRVDNQEWTIKCGQSRVDNQEWTIQRHWVNKTQDEHKQNTKNTTQKPKKMNNTDPIKIRGRSQVLANGKQFPW